MIPDDKTKVVFSTKIEGGGSVSFRHPLPAFLEGPALSMENKSHGIDYYLLARYAHLHRMHSSFMINAFWAVEHMILSILVSKYQSKEEFSKSLAYHKITQYWEEAKLLITELTKHLEQFDSYIGKVQGYFLERYPTTPTGPLVTFTSKLPSTKNDPVGSSKPIKFKRAAHISLSELDHFVNFMIHEVLRTEEIVAAT